ncbi:MAG TPA: YfcC family protein [Virgibacillus sp.]|nr:YfcC family protein [Virgibacillus sp.]HLR68566.1 YfcC family protein [Virgibacillus sp.]
MEKAEGKTFKFPNVIIILLCMMLLAMVATWVIPSGEYERVENSNGQMLVVPDSYSKTESSPVGLFTVFKAIPEGLTEAGMIAWTILIIGGTWQVLNTTGSISMGIEKMLHKLGKREFIIIPIMMLIFATIASFIGALELAIVYVPIMISLCIALRLDLLTAVAICLVSVGGAFAASLTNPFTVGLGQQIAGLPLYSGILYRLVVLVTFTVVGILFVLRYVSKIKKNPKNSLVYKENIKFIESYEEEKHTPKKYHGYIGLLLIIAFGIIIYGVLKLGWFMFEIGAIFFVVAFVSGLIAKMSLDDITDNFIKGANSVLLAALVVGLARGILIIIENGMIIDTIIFGLVNIIEGLPDGISAVGYLLAQSIFNFLVPSGSGQVLITMPILSSVSEIVGITQQTTVLATQLGDGITNILYPVSGALMASLAIAKVPYMTWLRFIMPLIVTWTVLGSIFLVIAQFIQWGPF